MLTSGLSEQITSGSLLPAILVAMLAGLVSFLSPCVVPLLPGYFAYATGLSVTDLGSANRKRMLLGSILFVLGFAAVFTLGGAFFGAAGSWLLKYQRPLAIFLGVVTIVLGLVFAGGLNWFQRDLRVHKVPAVGLAAAPLLGALFGLGWTPCIGPTLTAVLALSYEQASAQRGAILSFAYALGLGLPFVLAGLAWQRSLAGLRWVRQHQIWVSRLGGGLLIVIGMLLITGAWDQLIGNFRTWFFPDFVTGL